MQESPPLLVAPGLVHWFLYGNLTTLSDLAQITGSLRPLPDSYPLPQFNESMECLSGAKYLTTLDLHSGFLQVPVAPNSEQYTAFINSRGLFEFNFLPFGLRNAPATFSQLMQFVLSGLLFQSSILYMDNILVCSNTWEEHLKDLEEIFIRLDHYNL